MGIKPFQFKHFSVYQNNATHKVGTDGVLLGAWVSILADDRSMLDIGTGTGLIALMLAQRTGPQVRIDAIEIDATDSRQAEENILQSPWPEKIGIHHIPLQEFTPQKKYDLIVTNPPFFVNSLPPPEKKRRQARHTRALSFEDLVTNAARLLHPHGRLAIILPPKELMQVANLALRSRLFPFRRTNFRSRPHKPVERALVEFGADKDPWPTDEIVLHSDGNSWSEDYRNLTRDFYLDIH